MKKNSNSVGEISKLAIWKKFARFPKRAAEKRREKGKIADFAILYSARRRTWHWLQINCIVERTYANPLGASVYYERQSEEGKKGGEGGGGGGKTAPRHGERAACRLKFHAIHVFVNTALRDNVISGKEEIGESRGVISIQPARWLDQDGALVRTMGGKIIIFFSDF